MDPSEIHVAQCPAPEGTRFPDTSVWWAASLDGQVIAKMGVFPWELDDALCITQEPGENSPFLEVTTVLVEEIVRFSSMAGYSGVYAITYSDDPVLPPVLEKAAFQEVGQGRRWSENPTTFWFRESR